MVRNPPPGFDPGFIKRIYLATLGLSLVVVLCLLGRVELRWVGGFVLGDALGLALLKSNEMITTRLMAHRPDPRDELGARRAGRWLMLAQLGKYPVVAGLLYAGIVPLKLPPVAVLCGYGMVQVVILLKLAGRALSQRRERGVKGRRQKGIEASKAGGKDGA